MGATALVTALSALAFGAGADGAHAHAQMPEKEIAAAVRSYQIPAGRVSTALNQLADESGVQIVYDTGLTRSLKTRGLTGPHTLGAALAKLLSGTGLHYELSEDGKSVLIVLAQNDTGTRTDASGAEALPPIDVGAAQPLSDGGAGPATGSAAGNGTDIGPGNNGQICASGICNDPTSYSAPVKSLGTKVNTRAIETPLAVKVVTQQMLEDQQVTSLDEALRNVSGVYVTGGGASTLGTSFSGIVIRGFSTNAYYRDGIRIDQFQATNLGVGAVEIANVESVEVLKGPAAILYGAVEPGGIVNLNTKQPMDHPAYSIQQQFGSFRSYRTSFDATGPLTENKDVLYRFVGSYENDASFQTYGYNRNFMFNPTIKWNISGDTWIKLTDQYQENRLDQTFSFIPYYNNVVPLFLGRSMNWGAPSPLSQQQNFAELVWHHDFNKDWSVQHSIFWQSLTKSNSNNTPYSMSDCITPGGNCSYYGVPNTVQVIGGTIPASNRQAEYASVLDITGHFNTGELKHTALLGADYYRYNERELLLGWNQPSSVTLFGNPALPPTAAGQITPFFATEQYADNVGAYVQDQIKLPEGLQALAGARYQYINNKISSSDPGNFCGVPNNAGQVIPCNFDTETLRHQAITQRVTPRAALLWHPYEWVSLYGNYVKFYSPNYNGLLVLGTNLPNPPSAGQQEEGGIKFEFLDKKLQISADYFHLVKTNIPVGIPNDYVHELLIGEARAQGPELDVQGELLPGWTINLGYANINSKVTKSSLLTSYQKSAARVAGPLCAA